MANIYLIPTHKMRREAKQKNENPFEYLDKIADPIPQNAECDKRRKNKFDNEYLEDILVIRDDDSKIIIHEIESDISSLKKVELSEIDQNYNLTQTINAYTDGLDFSKMQNDDEYLDCLANSLLSPERIEVQKHDAEKEGLKEIYIGTIQRSEETDQYVIKTREAHELKLYKILAIKKALESVNEENETEKIEKEKIKKQRIEKQNKFKMISAINSQLETMSSEDLSKLCELLKISIDDLDLDNSR